MSSDPKEQDKRQVERLPSEKLREIEEHPNTVYARKKIRGLSDEMEAVEQALEAQRQELDQYRTAFDWDGMRSWAESVRAQWEDYEAKDDDSFAYPALKLSDKILEGLAALEGHETQDD